MKTTVEITGDCGVELDLTKTIKLGILLLNWAYDTNSIINYAEKLGINIVIPPKSNRKSIQNFESDLCRLHHIAKNTFLKFKSWHGIAPVILKFLLPSLLLVLFVLFPCLLLLLIFFIITHFFLKLFSYLTSDNLVITPTVERD